MTLKNSLKFAWVVYLATLVCSTAAFAGSCPTVSDASEREAVQYYEGGWRSPKSLIDAAGHVLRVKLLDKQVQIEMNEEIIFDQTFSEKVDQALLVSTSRLLADSPRSTSVYLTVQIGSEAIIYDILTNTPSRSGGYYLTGRSLRKIAHLEGLSQPISIHYYRKAADKPGGLSVQGIAHPVLIAIRGSRLSAYDVDGVSQGSILTSFPIAGFQFSKYDLWVPVSNVSFRTITPTIKLFPGGDEYLISPNNQGQPGFYSLEDLRKAFTLKKK